MKNYADLLDLHNCSYHTQPHPLIANYYAMFSESTCKVFEVEPVLRTHFNQCLSDFSHSKKDTTPYYEPGWKPAIAGNSHEHGDFCPEPWHYEEPFSVSESFLPYGGGGYVAKLGYDAATALMVKEGLEGNNWIDEKSVAVVVEFVVFEPANLLLSDVMLLLEKFPSGMRRTRIDVTPEYIFPSSGSAVRTFYRVSILLWFITILVLLFIEIVRCFKQGRTYFKSFFSWVSMLQILSSFCAVLIVFVKENNLIAFLQRIRENPFGDWSAIELVVWSSFQEVILSVAVVTTTINCLKLIQINRHVQVMKWTLQSAYRYLCSFAVVITMLALAFAQLGTLLFGSADEEYATLYYALRTVLKMAIGIGKIQFSKMNSGGESEFFAPIFLMACMLSMTIIFVNTFIAILDDAFHQASGREYSSEELGAYMKSCLINRIKKTNSNSAKKVFRKSPFRRSIRRKYSILPPKREVQRTKEHSFVLQKERAKLAESESLSSCESLSFHEEFQSMANTQATQTSSIDRNTKYTGIEVLNANCAEESESESLKNKEFYFKTPPIEEEHLSDVAKIMETVRSDFTRSLWEDEEWYNSRSSFSSCHDSFEELDKSAAVLFSGAYKQEVSSNKTWSYVRSTEKRGQTVYHTMTRESYTEVLSERYV